MCRCPSEDFAEHRHWAGNTLVQNVGDERWPLFEVSPRTSGWLHPKHAYSEHVSGLRKFCQHGKDAGFYHFAFLLGTASLSVK